MSNLDRPKSIHLIELTIPLSAGLILLLLPFLGLAQSQQLITCGDDRVTIFDLAQSNDTTPFIVWEWNASTAEDLPIDYRENYFKSIDECKCVDRRNRILITSSSQGVVLLDRSSKKVIFYATVGNAHSAEWLPGNRIAVMGSTNKVGNRIVLFDVERSEEPIFQDSIYSGHGVVWDDDRKLLYALGFDELRAYRLEDWNRDAPKLSMTASWKIPGESGHDLTPMPDQLDKLILTEHHGAWIFDKNTHDFEPFSDLANVPDVKAITIQERTGRRAYVKAETSWWSSRVYLLDPPRHFTFPGRHLYKVRWVQ